MGAQRLRSRPEPRREPPCKPASPAGRGTEPLPPTANRELPPTNPVCADGHYRGYPGCGGARYRHLGADATARSAHHGRALFNRVRRKRGRIRGDVTCPTGTRFSPVKPSSKPGASRTPHQHLGSRISLRLCQGRPVGRAADSGPAQQRGRRRDPWTSRWISPRPPASQFTSFWQLRTAAGPALCIGRRPTAATCDQRRRGGQCQPGHTAAAAGSIEVTGIR